MLWIGLDAGDVQLGSLRQLARQGRRAISADHCVAPADTRFTHNSLGGLLHEELKSLLNPQGIEVGFDGMVVEV